MTTSSIMKRCTAKNKQPHITLSLCRLPSAETTSLQPIRSKATLPSIRGSWILSVIPDQARQDFPVRMPLPTSKHFRWLYAITLAAVLAVLFFLNPTEYVFMPKCPFKLITGLQCPGCGLQRACHALLRGHVAEAWAYNRFLIYAIPWLLSVILTEYFLHGERQMRWRRVVEGRVAVGIYLVLFVWWGVFRNIEGI